MSAAALGVGGLLALPFFILGVGMGWLTARADVRRARAQEPFRPCEIVDFQAARERRGCA